MSNLPDAPDTDKPKKKKGGCLKIGFLVLVVLAIVLHFTFEGVAKNIANKKLPEILQTEATLGSVQVALPVGLLGIKELSIAQPEGFEGEQLIQLNQFSVSVPLRNAMNHNPLLIRKVHLDGLDFNLISDTNHVLNVTKLAPPASEEPEDLSEVDDDPKEAKPFPVWLKHLLVENINVHFQDLAKEWTISLTDIRLDVRNLQVEHDNGTGPALVTGDIFFPGGKAPGHMKLLAKVGTVTPSKPDHPPTIQLAIGLMGFDLDLVAPFLAPSPAVAKTAFGGSGFDFLIFLQLNDGNTPEERAVSGEFLLVTDKGQKTDGELSGTLAAPELPFTSLFADILGNQFGRVAGMGGNVAKGSVEAGKAVVGTGATAVKGAGKSVIGFAGGALKSVKGVVTLDAETAVGGLKDATVGTAGDLKDTVTDTAGSAVDGVGNTAGAVTGSTKQKKWWTEVEQRVEEFEKQADVWFNENPFPTADAL
ncbi:AsmA family protein [Kiritimatiellota bacterium B12222]|nr:AsmA family protein [Kiritimatiellota bacterium B12222]